MRTLALRTTLALSFAVGTFAGPAAAQGVEIQYGTTSPPGNVQYFSSEEFIKRVNARIGHYGRIMLYHSSQLGSDAEMLQKLRLGTQDMSQPSTIMSSVTPEFGMFDLPYLVKDRAHMRCIAREIVWPILAPKIEARGYKLIGIWENGFRHITNNVRPIVTPADLRGLKIRVPQGVWRVKMFQVYGASPSPLPFSEVFVALQTGVMDGQENPYVNVDAGKFQEVQRYLTETRHVYTPSFPTASLRKFRRLSAGRAARDPGRGGRGAGVDLRTGRAARERGARQADRRRDAVQPGGSRGLRRGEQAGLRPVRRRGAGRGGAD